MFTGAENTNRQEEPGAALKGEGKPTLSTQSRALSCCPPETASSAVLQPALHGLRPPDLPDSLLRPSAQTHTSEPAATRGSSRSAGALGRARRHRPRRCGRLPRGSPPAGSRCRQPAAGRLRCRGGRDLTADTAIVQMKPAAAFLRGFRLVAFLHTSLTNGSFSNKIFQQIFGKNPRAERALRCSRRDPPSTPRTAERRQLPLARGSPEGQRQHGEGGVPPAGVSVRGRGATTGRQPATRGSQPRTPHPADPATRHRAPV